jgi:hypothetical protein
VRLEKLVFYQELADKRVHVDASFRVSGRHVSFRLAKYRRDLPLIIDPVLTYSTYVGGSGDDFLTALAVDSTGSLYIGGDTLSANFPVTSGASDTAFAARDLFVAKLNSAGTALVYSTFIGGPDLDGMADMDVTPDGRVVVLGEGTLAPTPGALQDCCWIVARLNAAGSALEYVARAGANGRAIKALPDGSVVVGGDAFSDVITTPGAYQRTRQGQDAYILKLNAAGSVPLFGTYLGSSGADFVRDVGVNAAGDVYVTGVAASGFPQTPGAYGGGGGGAYVTRIGADGSALVYSARIPGATPDRLAVGAAGDVWISGRTSIGITTTPGAYLSTPPGGGDAAFLVRLNAAGTSAAFSTYTGAVTSIMAGVTPVAVAVNAAGEAYVSGAMSGPVTLDAHQRDPAGTYMQRFDPSGSALRYATYHGSASSLPLAGLAIDSANNVYIGGVTNSGMPVTAGALQGLYAGGSSDGFVAKITPSSVPCSFVLTPVSASHSAAGATGTIGVAAPDGCSWLATPFNSDAVAVTSAAFGVGSGTVTYMLRANSGPARLTTITVGGQSFTIAQADASGCLYSLTAREASVPSAGASGNVGVTPSNVACAWNAASDSGWVQLYPLSGTGPAVIGYTVFPNYTAAPRTARLTIAGWLYTLTQAPATGTTQERFVGEMYFASFGRVASAAEIAGQVAAGLSQPELVNAFLNTPEFHNAAKYVAGLYVGILGRDAEYGGWMFQRNAMSQLGANPYSLAENFLNSAEFNMKNPGISDAEFVKLLYRQVLGREATPDEVAFQVANLKSRTALAAGFLMSDEYKIRVGPRLTGFLLHAVLYQRDPSPAELNLRAGQIAAGVPLTAIITEMLAQR